MVQTWEENKRDAAIELCINALVIGKGWNLKLDHINADYDGMVIWVLYTYRRNGEKQTTLLSAYVPWSDLLGLAHKRRYSDVDFGDYEGKPEYVKVCQKVIKDIHKGIKQYIKEHPNDL